MLNNPFSNFSPVQKSILYRAIEAYKNKLQLTIIEINQSAVKTDYEELHNKMAEFQISECKQLMDLFKAEANINEVGIIQHFNEWLKKENNTQLM